MAGDASTPAPPGGLAATTFFSKTYDETRALLADAREYVELARAIRWDRTTTTLDHSVETMRLSARLMHVMAWLLVQRAVHAGEIGPEQAREAPHRLGGRAVCFASGGEGSGALPARLRELLRRSRKLYQRVARLDEMVRRDRG